MQEIFMRVPIKYGGYLVGDRGTVMSIKTSKPLSPITVGGRYQYVNLKSETTSSGFSLVAIHRLMLLTFKAHEYFTGATVDHKNNDYKDNRLENLRWLSLRENVQRARNKVVTLTQELVLGIMELRRSNNWGKRRIANELGLTETAVGPVLLGLTWSDVTGLPKKRYRQSPESAKRYREKNIAIDKNISQ